eukprot:jgi/Picsp_1/2318/NSC_05781-R1_---NA---
MEEAFREGNAGPHQSQRASHAAKMQSVEARLVEGRQRLTMLRLCAVVALHPGQATTAATACPLDPHAGQMTSASPPPETAKGAVRVFREERARSRDQKAPSLQLPSSEDGHFVALRQWQICRTD